MQYGGEGECSAQNIGCVSNPVCNSCVQLRIQYAASRTGQQPSVYKRNGRALSGTSYDDVREVELDDKKINEGLVVELY